MSLLVAVPAALCAAAAYGSATAVQHSVTNTGGDVADAAGLLRAIRDPRWLLATCGDGVGLILQVIALATGPVVVVQPILVLALPISLPIAKALGGPAPKLREFRACGLIVAGLAAFFGIVGDPGAGHALAVRAAVIVTVVAAAAGGAALLGAARTGGGLKAAIYGAVAGAWFGVVAVFMDASATAWERHGLAAFGHARGLVPLVALIVMGAASMVLTQVSFQIGSIGASFPASLVADPVVAVILGGVLLSEHVPLSTWTALAYAACLAAILSGAVVLGADPVTGRGERPGDSSGKESPGRP